MHNDKKRAVLWAKEHWQIAAIACVFMPVIGAMLVWMGVMTERIAVAATVVGIVYVLMTTWDFTHDHSDKNHKAG